MLQQAFSFSFFILSFIFSFLSVSTANSNVNVYVQCSQLNFTSMTPYESNVNSLFTSLVDSASLYNFNKFEISPQSECVYGLFQCRGDLSSPKCEDCVASAISQLKTTCSTSTGGEIQLEGCFVKYDDTSFFGVEDKMEVCKKCGPSMGYNSDVMNRIDGALAYLVGGNREYFRGGDFGSIWGVAQCVQDLSLSDCQDCLSEACGRLKSECETSTWGDMYLGKCYIRYASEGNKNLPNNSNPASNNRNDDGRVRVKSMGKWVYFIIAGIVGAATGLSCYCTNNCYNCCINVFNLQGSVNDMKGDVKELRKDLDETKGDVKDARKDLDGTKGDVKDVKKDVDGNKGEIKDLKKDLDGTKAEIKKDMAGIKGEVKSIKNDVEYGKELFRALSRNSGPQTPMQPPYPELPYSYPKHLPSSYPYYLSSNSYPYHLPPSDSCHYLPPPDQNTRDLNPNACSCM